MEYPTLIPDSVQASSGNPPAATGAAASDPVEDASDATWIRFNALAQWIRLSFADYALPANKRIWALYVMGRKLFAEQVDGSGWGAFGQGNRLGPVTVTDTTHLAGLQGSYGGENAWVNFYSPWHFKDWAGVEWTQAQVNGLHFYDKVTLLNAPVVYLYSARYFIGLAVITQPVGAITQPTSGQTGMPLLPLFKWSYTGFGEAQNKYRIRVFTAAVAEGGGFDPATSANIYDSGLVTSSATQHQMPAGILALGTSYYVSVQVSKTMDFNGQSGLGDYLSLWSSAIKFTINAAPVTTVTTPADPTINATTPIVTWTYTDADANPQTTWQAKVFTAAQYGIGGFDPAGSPNTWDSGETADANGLVRSVVVGVALANATYRAYVRTKDSDGNYSAWAFKQWVQNVVPPNPGTLAVSQVVNSSDLLVQWEAAYNGTIPDFFKLERSDDGGVTWSDVRGAGYQAIAWSILDTFTRADNAAALGNDEKLVPTAWVANTGVWGILANRAYTAAATAAANATMNTGTADIIAQVTVAVLPGANTAGIIFRRVDAANYWVAQVSNGNLQLWRIVANVGVQVGGSYAAAAGDAITVLAIGNSITVKQNGVVRITTVDAANQQGTQHGMWLGLTNVARLDDFTVRPISQSLVTDREASPREIGGTVYTARYRLTVYDQLVGDVAASNPTTLDATLDVKKVWLKLPKLYAVTDDYTRNATFPSENVTLPKSVNKQRTVHRPLGRTRPVVVRGINEGRAFSASFVVETQALYDKIAWLLNRNVTLVLVTSKDRYYVDVANWTDEEHLWDELHGEQPYWRISVDYQEVAAP